VTTTLGQARGTSRPERDYTRRGDKRQARQAVARLDADFVLPVRDWSFPHYPTHASKTEAVRWAAHPAGASRYSHAAGPAEASCRGR
jgi:hypothetical protein